MGLSHGATLVVAIDFFFFFFLNTKLYSINNAGVIYSVQGTYIYKFNILTYIWNRNTNTCIEQDVLTRFTLNLTFNIKNHPANICLKFC